VVLSEPGVYDLLNGSKKHKNKKVLREAFDRVIYALKYENSGGLVDIFSFSAKMQIALDTESEWFKDLWYPLTKSRPPPGGGPTFGVEQPLILTQSLLKWLGYKGRDIADIQDHFKRFLDSLKLPYRELSATDPLAITYPRLQTERLELETSNNLVKKKWICMDVKQFKKVVMRLNTESADVVRDYYLNLEELMFDYAEYTKMYLVAQRDKETIRRDNEMSHMMHQLALKERSEEELKQELEDAEKAREDAEKAREDAEREVEKERLLKHRIEQEAKATLQRALAFNQATKVVEPTEYVYIATTTAYARENKYKPGGCATFELLRSRLSQYNSGKSDSDSHFFVYVRKVVSYRAVEQMLQSCLGGFRENACKELFIINYEWLIKCVDAVIDHNSEFLEFVNTYRAQIVEDTMNKAPVAATPVRLEKIKVSYQRVGEEEIELTIFNRETIDAIRSALEEFSPDNDTVKRSVFEGFLKERHPEVDIAKRKRPLWDVVKRIGESVNPNWRYKY
jgi:hypothetical protein